MTSPILLPRTTPRRRPIAFATLAALLFVLPVAAGCSKNSSSEAPAAGPDPVIARVNGVDIKQSDLALAEEDVGADMQAASPEAKREHLISYLADIIMVTQAADKKKLADNPDFKRRLAFLRNKLLMGYELQDEAKAALTDDALHQTYNDAVKSMGGQEEVHARHILVENEDEAKAILDQLKGGADFATLAKEKSKDPGAAEGGDLGFFTKDQMVPEFADVAFKMYPGQLSNPVKTQFGWHIIKVEDKRTKQPPEFEKVKDQIEAFLARKAQTDFITKLRQTAKVERLDKPAEQKPPEPKSGLSRNPRTDRISLRGDRGRARRGSPASRAEVGGAASSELRQACGALCSVSSQTCRHWAGHGAGMLEPYDDHSLAARTRALSRHAAGGGRQAGDRRRRHPLPRAYRRAVGAVRPGTTVAGVFTRSKCPSAPVDWCRAQLKQGAASVLVVNSGNANAFTGKSGRAATKLTAKIAAAAAQTANRHKSFWPRPE